jgi:arylsulfatase A-like enzyme/cytochrome c-type biogenesis protein CcmH/NrfG
MKKKRKKTKNTRKKNHNIKVEAPLKEEEKSAPSEPSPAKRKSVGLIAAMAGAVVIAVAVIIYLVSTGGRSPLKKSEPKDLNVILITIDTLRADYLSCYREDGVSPQTPPETALQTPHLDKLAGEGVRFKRCIAQSPFTLPSHATILSGTYPLHHRVRDNGGFLVPDELEMVSELLQAKGYVTSAFIGAYVLHSKWGINQGFDTYSDSFDVEYDRNTGIEIEKRAGEVLGDARQWLLENKDDTFFTWIHLFDPHAPYEAPPPHEKGYKGEVEYTDQQLGRFFDFLKETGLYDKSLIIVTADHGEGLHQHGEATHGLFVYETTVWVPLIIRAPFTFPVNQIDKTVELVDVAPTILDALDVPIPQSYQGMSLLDLMYGRPHKKPDMAYTEAYYSRLHFGWSELKAIYSGRWKYILAPEEELYDIEKDGDEMDNMAPEKSNDKAGLRKRLLDFVAKKSRRALVPGRVKKLNPADAEKLRSLGYLTGGVETSGKQNLPDPKHKLDFFNDFFTAREWALQGKNDQAIQRLTELAKQEPGNVDCLMVLGEAYRNKNMHNEAFQAFRRVLELKPDYNDAMVSMVRALIELGQTEQAIAAVEKSLEMFPEDYSLLYQLGTIYLMKDDYDRALQYFQKSLDVEPVNSSAFVRIGEIRMKKGDTAAAESFFKKALALNPRAHRAHFYMAQAEKSRGNTAGVIEHYKKELEVNPDSGPTAYLLAEELKQMGDFQQAVTYYRLSIKADPLMKMSYFRVAEYLFQQQENLEEAVELCKKGLEIIPEDEGTLFGYYILTNIYALKGDQANLNYYTAKGEKLYNRLNK